MHICKISRFKMYFYKNKNPAEVNSSVGFLSDFFIIYTNCVNCTECITVIFALTRLRHVFNENSVAHCGVVHQNIGKMDDAYSLSFFSEQQAEQPEYG